MKHAVLTSKHHDGFCLFDSKYTDFKITNSPYGKDVVREFLDAFRAEGLKVGIYYSLLDWDHPDFPHYADDQHPMRNNPKYKNYNYNFDNYITYMHNQVEELCTNYGKLDMIWFDFSYPGMEGEKWEATKLVRMVKKYQPDALMDTRLGTGGDSFGTLVTEHPTEYAGDFASCEQVLPPEPIRDYKGELVPWEACMTLNNNWGYHRYDYEYKTPRTIIRSLVDCISKGGNLLLNIGPNVFGEIPKESVKILTEKGIDVGLRGVGNSVIKDLLYFPKYDDMVKGNYTDMATFEIEVDDSAEVITYCIGGEKNYIDAYHYENALGQKFLVYSFDIALTDENRYRNYLTQLQLFDSIEWLSGKKNIVKCAGNPDLYVLAKQKGNETAIGLWNLFTDGIITPTIELDHEYAEAEFVNCTGELKGDKVVLSTIHPYGMAFINLK